MGKNNFHSLNLFAGLLLLIITASCGDAAGPAAELKFIAPEIRTIRQTVITTGVVQPRNRLQIIPPINGRIESINVREGDSVKAGQVLADMSSDERAALIDAARTQGRDAVRYWEETYRPIPLISPISGTVIVRSVEPGQTITSASPVLVISDRLIIEADVDETDIGKIRKGQQAVVSLDAYPEVITKGEVSHISYESTTASNVTIYKVRILTSHIPDVYRSGMSANIEIIQRIREGVTALPIAAVKKENGRSFVLVLNSGKTNTPEEKTVKTGIFDTDWIEITEGLSPGDRIAVDAPRDFTLPSGGGKSNPFMPARKK